MSGVQPKLNSVCVAESKAKCEQNTEPQNESFMRKAASSVFDLTSTAAEGIANGARYAVWGVCYATSSAVGFLGDTVGVVGDAIGAVGDIFRPDDDGQLDLES